MAGEGPAYLTVVKRGRHRTVSRFEVAGRTYYVKAYACPSGWRGLGRRLRALFGVGPGRREWEALLAAKAAGLDVPEPVALGRGTDERLVTAGVPDGERLDEYLFERYFEPLPGDPPYPGARPPELVAAFRVRRPPAAGTIDPKTLAYRLANLVAHLADADLYLPDLHPGNILIAGLPGRWRLYLVDLAEAVRPAPAEAVLRHLVRLEHFFEPIAAAAERLRCLRRLSELVGDVPAAPVIPRATARYRRRFYRRRDRRTRRQSKYFRRLSAGGWEGWATADWAPRIEQLLHQGDPTTDPARARPVKQGRTAGVWRVTLEDGRSLFVKQHKLARDRSSMRTSRSIAAFRKGHALLIRGIATARPAAAVDRRQGGRLVDTLLLTEPVEGGEPLSDWLRRGPRAADRRRIARRLARMIRQLHEAGFSHRDLKAPNILIAPADGPAAQPILVDLDGLVRDRRVSPSRRVQNLTRLSVSLDEWGVARATDRLRFLRAYLATPGCLAPIATRSRHRGCTEPGERLRRWWWRIARTSAKKMEILRQKQRGTART